MKKYVKAMFIVPNCGRDQLNQNFYELNTGQIYEALAQNEDSGDRRTIKGEGCYGNPRRDLLIVDYDDDFLKQFSREKCYVISFEWGIVRYERGDTILLKKEKLLEIRTKIKKGLDIR